MSTVPHRGLLLALLGVLSCRESPPEPGWLRAGPIEDVRPLSFRGKAPSAAVIERLTATPGEDSQLALAQAYFPKLLDTPREPLPELPEETLLHVRPPSRASDALRLTTCGLTFSLRGPGAGDAARHDVRGAAFYDEGHFWTAADGDDTGEGAWRTSRVEEFVVLREATGTWRSRYTLTLPPEVTVAQEAGDSLALVNTRARAVLYLRFAVARDAAGVQRQGTVRLLDARPEGLPREAPARYAVSGTISLELTVELTGLKAPVVIWARGLRSQARAIRCGTP